MSNEKRLRLSSAPVLGYQSGDQCHIGGAFLMLIQADARTLPLADGCASCVVTSPPYWGLRDYGDPQQIGLESTPDAYVAQLVAVFREVRRVLADDGTVWLNLGDSYAGSGPSGASYQSETTIRRAGMASDGAFRISKTLEARGLSYAEKKPVPPPGLKTKDLCGIPWRVAFALQADGWYLRSDIIWSKPNPMPESVTDRPTKAHEYIFLLAKAARYYYDADAVREQESPNTASFREMQKRFMANQGRHKLVTDASRTLRADDVNDRRTQAGLRQTTGPEDGKRNKRSVWHVATQPYPDAHFATFPEALIEPCILAGCPVGGRVLDPFIGSGTTGAVAERLGRRWVGVDLTYQHLARERTAQRGLMWESAATSQATSATVAGLF